MATHVEWDPVGSLFEKPRTRRRWESEWKDEAGEQKRGRSGQFSAIGFMGILFAKQASRESHAKAAGAAKGGGWASWNRRAFLKAINTLQTQSKVFLLVEALALVALIGAADAISGWDVSLFLFYAFPILLAVWFGDRRLALVCAVACGVAWFWANNDSHPYTTAYAYAWAAFNRAMYFLFVAFGGTAMKQQGEEFRARMEALTRARELEQEIVRVSEREQMRIGQELHDGLCQNLAAIDCAAACLRTDLEAKALPEAATAEAIQRLLKEAVVETRDLARGIFPVQMDADGLAAALEELVGGTNRPPRVAVTFECDGEAGIDDPQTAMHLYRIAQQALNNALSHAAASLIRLRLCWEKDGMTMSIADNGRGFSPALRPSQGMGLRTMQYRAHLIGAELVVESNPATGTEVRCTLTFPHAYHS